MIFNQMFADGSLQNYIEQNLADPWKGTPFEGYVYMSPKQKGEFGERFTTKYLEHLGHEVKGLRWVIIAPMFVLIPYLLFILLVEGFSNYV